MITLVLISAGVRGAACDLALVMAVDVSGSVDNGEYHIQMQGLADGLRDSSVSEALVAGEAALLVLQWTGTTRQRVSVPWTQMRDLEDLEAFAQQVESAPRAWRNFSTAIGEALNYAGGQFADAPDCDRRVIDISGDGSSNEGLEPTAAHDAMRATGIVVNALVIEGAEPNLSDYFRDNVVVGNGSFVITANSFDVYPDRMRRKLLREVTKQISMQEGDSKDHRDDL